MKNCVAEDIMYDARGNEVFANNELHNRIRLANRLQSFIEKETDGKYLIDTAYFVAGKDILFLTQAR